MRSNSCRNTFRAFSSIFFIVFLVCILSVFTYADTACAESASGIATLLSEQHYQADEPITVIYRIRSEVGIANFAFSSEGFSVISAEIAHENEKEIVVSFMPSGGWEENAFAIEVLLTSGEMLKDCLYATQNQYGVFVSVISKDTAYKEYLAYAVETGIMTEEERSTIWKRRNASGATTTVTTIMSAAPIGGSVSTNAANAVDTWASGTLTWVDDYGTTHPLRGVKVEVYDEDPLVDDLLGTTFTNDQGYFIIGFANNPLLDNGGRDLYICVYAGDDNVIVKSLDGQEHVYQSEVEEENVNTGSTTDLSICFHMTKVNPTTGESEPYEFGQALQVGQAAMTARNYAEAMMESEPTAVTIYYPGARNSNGEKGCFYRYPEMAINITDVTDVMDHNTPNSYASWDAIMHEYGHHMQYQLNIIDYPDKDEYDGKHYSGENAIDTKESKDVGVRLAWAEAWPTVFGMQAQYYYASLLEDIQTTANGYYEAYNFESSYLVVNSTLRLGEGCERSIMAVLWDMYDSANNYIDTLSLGHEDYWMLVYSSQAKTFSEFIAFTYALHPEYKQALGPLLTYYKMSASAPTVLDIPAAQLSKIPTVTWDAQGGSVDHPNNYFSLYFYKEDGNLLTFFVATGAQKNVQTGKYEYTLTQSQWNTIYTQPDQKYRIAVAASQLSTPVTGPYFSEMSDWVTKPDPSPTVTNTSMAATDRYKEFINTLAPRQYADYIIRFHSAGIKIIQTFGWKDTKISIFNSSYELITSNDDAGYSTNALISLNVAANSLYVIRVEIVDATKSGTYKLALTPSDTAYGSYEAFANASGLSDVDYAVSTHDAAYYRYTSSNSGKWIQFCTEASFDAYLYLIDPRSTAAMTENFGDSYKGPAANDDGGGGTDAMISQQLDAGVPYLVIVVPRNPSTQSGSFTLWIDVFDS